MKINWKDTYFDLVDAIAKKSKDRSTKVGAVIVGPDQEVRSMGYNGFPRNVNDEVDERHQRPLKYKWTEHAERNAIYNAARVGIPLKGCSIYISYVPCTDCARAIIQSGINEVVCKTLTPLPGWEEDQAIALEMMMEAGLTIIGLD
jgi:dCMP deaminase